MLAQIVGVRLEDDQSAAAVDREHVAIVDLLQHVRGADHQRHVQAAGENRAVRQWAAAGGDHGQRAALVFLSCIFPFRLIALSQQPHMAFSKSEKIPKANVTNKAKDANF